jgi:hypothetical protein
MMLTSMKFFLSLSHTRIRTRTHTHTHTHIHTHTEGYNSILILGFCILLCVLYQGYQEKPSFATIVQGVYCILYLDRYMFRPSLAIIKGNAQYNI